MLFCYSIGKAQRILAELARHTDRPVFVHGMMLADDRGLSRGRRRDAAGASRRPTSPAARRSRASSILAPLPARGTPWMRRLGTHSDALRLRPDARPRRPPSTGVRSRVRALGSRGLAGAAADDRGDRRQPGARDPRPRRAAGALPARAGARRGRDPDGVGGGSALGTESNPKSPNPKLQPLPTAKCPNWSGYELRAGRLGVWKLRIGICGPLGIGS